METSKKPITKKTEIPKKESGTEKNISKTKNKKCCKSKNFNLGFVLGIIISSVIIVILFNVILSPFTKSNSEFTIEDAQQKTANLINDTFLEGDTKNAVTIKSGTEENGLYKITVTTAQNQDIDVYLTKDGKLFIENVVDIAEVKNKKGDSSIAPEKTLSDIEKMEKPVVELFVMSQCPYGTQMEKGFLPVINTLGDKIDFKVKFVYYAMHKKVEVDEQMNQYCIQKEEESKYIDYLKCFLDAGKTDDCLKETNINTAKIAKCVSLTDKEFAITEQYNDTSTWINGNAPFDIYKADNVKYGVQGSPTLVVNGTKVTSARDPQSILNTICAGFENKPEECNTALPTVSAAPGFGFDKEGNATEASCE